MAVDSPFITDWVLEHASRTPEAPAVDGLQCRLAYGALAARVRDLAGDLAARGVTAQDRVVVAVPASPVAAVASLAVQLLGACAVEVDRGMGSAGLETVVEQARPRHAILAAQDAKLWSEVLKGSQLEAAWLVGAARGRPGRPGRLAARAAGRRTSSTRPGSWAAPPAAGRRSRPGT